MLSTTPYEINGFTSDEKKKQPKSRNIYNATDVIFSCKLHYIIGRYNNNLINLGSSNAVLFGSKYK